MLNGINWSTRSPYIQSLELSIQALVCYLQHEDYKEGLRLSLLSQQLGSISDAFPGSKKTQGFYQTYISVGELLGGNLDKSMVEYLEDCYKRFPILVKLLVAYCLSQVYMKMNMIEKAEEKVQYYKQAAPYCKPLFN